MRDGYQGWSVVINIQPNYPTWWKSSRSGPTGNCVEVARVGDLVAVRDSKNPDDGHLTFTRSAWSAFLSALDEVRPEDR